MIIERRIFRNNIERSLLLIIQRGVSIAYRHHGVRRITEEMSAIPGFKRG
jgi:hypothetical protein